MRNLTHAKAASKYQEGLLAKMIELDLQAQAINEEMDTVRAKLKRSIGLGHSVEVKDIALMTVCTTITKVADLDRLMEVNPRWVRSRKLIRRSLDCGKLGRLVKNGDVPANVAPFIKDLESVPQLRIAYRQS